MKNNTALMRNVGVVLAKEVIDALRDRRTLLRLLIPAVLMGPLLLLALSSLISSLEDRAEKREVLVLKIWGGLTYQQVADALRISANTAASRYRYALDKLREQLVEESIP